MTASTMACTAHEVCTAPFFTTKSEGTGLGLSISYGSVRDHEGTVDVKTGEGRGTRFVLTFPAAPEGRQA